MSSARDDGQAAERVVIRDKRKIDPSGGKEKEAEVVESEETGDTAAEATKDSAAWVSVELKVTICGRTGSAPVPARHNAAV